MPDRSSSQTGSSLAKDDLAAQLDALMAQVDAAEAEARDEQEARERRAGGDRRASGADDRRKPQPATKNQGAKTGAGSTGDDAVRAADRATRQAQDLASQVDAAPSAKAKAAGQPADAGRSPDPDAEAALEDLEDCFASVQEVMEEFGETLEASPESGADGNEVDADEVDAERRVAAAEQVEEEMRGEELVDQLQSMLDDDVATDQAAPVGASPAAGASDKAAEAEAKADPQTANALEAEAPKRGGDRERDASASDDPASPSAPMIQQIDSLLAEHAEEALDGDFEDVVAMLDPADLPRAEEAGAGSDGSERSETDAEGEDGSASDEPAAEGKSVAGKHGEGQRLGEAGSAGVEAEAGTSGDDEDDDELGGGFDSLEALLGDDSELRKADAEAEAPAEGGADAAADDASEAAGVAEAGTATTAEAKTGGDDDFELDLDLDGLFEAPADTPPPPPEPVRSAPVAEGADAEPVQGVYAGEEPEVAEADAAPGSSERSDAGGRASSGGWSVTINAEVLRRVLAVVLGLVFTLCTVMNRPMDKLPADVRQAVAWVALAIAGPGLGLVLYGLLLA